MTINLKFKSLIAAVFLAGISSMAAQSAENDKSLAPEATTSEAKLSFRDIPVLEEAFIDTAPADRKDGILRGELGVDSGNKDMIVNLAQEIADNKHGAFDSLLIVHKGKLIFESYYSRGRINLPHFQASATKVYTSLALGRAIQLGYLTMADLDKPLVTFLKDLNPTKFVEGIENITLHKAMTMRSGIRISKEQKNALEKNPSKLKGQGQVQAYFEQSAPITLKSQSFKYQFDPNLVMQVIEAVVPGTAKDFIKSELLDKMNITNYSWATSISGLPSSGSSANMTSRDMVKWGTLVANKGKWNEEQLVPEVFITNAINRIVHNSDDENFSDHGNISNTGYGYFWWQSDLSTSNKRYFSTSARGGGGQYIILIEELDLMVVVTAYDRNDNTLQLTAERILPAFFQNSIPPLIGKNKNQNKSPILKGPYIGQKVPGLTPEVFAPATVSTEHRDWGGSFSPDMKEYYFSRRNNKSGKNKTFVFKSENDRWYESAVDSGIFVSPDGKTRHAGKQYRERTNDGWSELKSIDSAFDDFHIMRLTTSLKGTYVFDEATRDGNGILRYSRLINGKREAPTAFSKEINTGKWTAHPFIAPDESYIIWDSENDGGYGGSDIYISFRQLDGSWGSAINFGDKINTNADDGGGTVTPDGKYFFFCRRCSPPDFEIMWVDAQFIETLRPKQSAI